MTLSGIASELLTPASGDHSMPSEGWQQWKQRDEQVRENRHKRELVGCAVNSVLPSGKPHYFQLL